MISPFSGLFGGEEFNEAIVDASEILYHVPPMYERVETMG